MKPCPRTPPIVPSEIPYRLNPDLPLLSAAEAEARFRAHPASAETIENWTSDGYGNVPPRDHFRWVDHWRQISYEDLIQVFSFEEIVRFWFDEFIMNKAGEHFKEHEELLWKIQHVEYQYGRDRVFKTIARHLDCLRALRCDLPGFEVRLTCSSHFNEFGPSVHMREMYEEQGPNLLPGQKSLYLDGPMGLLLYFKGVHVLTVGFAMCDQGVLVSQVQLRHKKGNRFLYHLPGHYQDVALQILADAFPEDPMYLVSGDSAPAAIRRAYTKENPCTMTPETEARITAFYDRDLRDYTRDRTRIREAYGRKFILLERRACNSLQKAA